MVVGLPTTHQMQLRRLKRRARKYFLLPLEHRSVNGVQIEPIVWGDPLHIANLVVMWASIAAFGETERGNHQQIHHQQLIQSLFDAVFCLSSNIYLYSWAILIKSNRDTYIALPSALHET